VLLPPAWSIVVRGGAVLVGRGCRDKRRSAAGDWLPWFTLGGGPPRLPGGSCPQGEWPGGCIGGSAARSTVRLVGFGGVLVEDDLLDHACLVSSPDYHRQRMPPKVLLVLADVFSATALGCLVLIGMDLSIGRPVSGDLFIGGLNAILADVFWAWFVQSRGRGPGSGPW
jgi:hypothetical protein